MKPSLEVNVSHIQVRDRLLYGKSAVPKRAETAMAMSNNKSVKKGNIFKSKNKRMVITRVGSAKIDGFRT